MKWDKMRTWNVHNITKKEILEIRRLLAEEGMELIPEEVEETIKLIKYIKENFE